MRYSFFKYTIIFFNLFNISVTFQVLINKILQDLINYICVVYLNNIFIYFKIREKY